MEALTIVGAVAACAQLVDLAAKVTRNLGSLKRRWSDGAQGLQLLIAKLSTVRAALDEIKDWADFNASTTPGGTEMVENLRIAMAGCQAIIEALDGEVMLVLNETRIPRLRQLFSEATMKEHENRLTSQVAALQLLLTAAYCKTVSEQNELLCRSTSRRILRRVRDNPFSAAQQPVGRESQPHAAGLETEAGNNAAPAIGIGMGLEMERVNRVFEATHLNGPATGPSMASREGYMERHRPLGVTDVPSHSALSSPTFPLSDMASAVNSPPYSMTPTSPSLASSNTSVSASSLAGSTSSFFRRLRRSRANSTTSRSVTEETPVISRSRLRIRHPGQYATTSIYLQSGAGVPPSPAVAAAQRGDRDFLWFIRYRADVHAPESRTGRTPLAVACHCGHGDIVQILLDVGADVSVSDHDRLTPLHLAAANGHCSIAEILIDRMADVDACDSLKRTPLRIACDHGQLAMMRTLMRHRGSLYVNARDEEGQTALHAASETGDEDVVGILLQFGANKDARDPHIRAPLHLACAAGHVGVVKELLAAKADIEGLEKERLTPLAIAARSGHAAVVDLLLQHKASPTAESVCRFTPLHWASCNGHEEAVGLIAANKKTNPNARDKHDRTPLHIAVTYGHFGVIEKLIESGADVEAECQGRNRPVHLACKYATHSELSLLLVAGADFNSRAASGETPLHVAVREGKVEITHYLLRYGAWVDVVDNKGVRPLAIACLAGYYTITDLLLLHGAALGVGNSPLETRVFYDAPVCLAARGGHTQILQLLFNRNADVREVDSSGWEPLRHAAFMGHAEAVSFLLANGARATDLGELADFSFSPAVSPEMSMRVTALLAVDVDVHGEHRDRAAHRNRHRTQHYQDTYGRTTPKPVELT